MFFLLFIMLSLSNNIDLIESTNSSSFYCRSRGKFLPVTAFQLETCAMCYQYMPTNMFNNGSKFKIDRNWNHTIDGVIVPWLTNSKDDVSIFLSWVSLLFIFHLWIFLMGDVSIFKSEWERKRGNERSFPPLKEKREKNFFLKSSTYYFFFFLKW